MSTTAELRAQVEVGWKKAYHDSWYLNATPSDNPEGVEAVSPDITAGRAAFTALMERLETCEREREALREWIFDTLSTASGISKDIGKTELLAMWALLAKSAKETLAASPKAAGSE